MNPPQLRDIHLPDANLWWPPAPGWWLLSVLLLLSLLLLPRLLRWIRYRPPRRIALQQLERIRRGHRQGRSDRAVLDEVAALLRRVTISYYGRSATASSTGEQWLRQLQQLAPGSDFSPQHCQLLTRGRYQAQAQFDVDSLLQACESWLRHLPRSSDRVSD